MRPAKSGMEVVEGDVVREIRDRKPQGDVRRILLLKQIISAETKIEYVARRNPRWIVVVVLRALRRYLQPRRAEISRCACIDSVIGRGFLVTTEETDCRLFGR